MTGERAPDQEPGPAPAWGRQLIRGEGWRSRLLGRVPVVGRHYTRLREHVQALHAEVADLRSLLVEVAAVPYTASGETLVRARREVMTHTDSADYRGLYHSEELLYWLHIPGWLAEWSAEARPGRILDIGAGYGTLAVFAALATGAEVFCLDTEPERISEPLRRRHRLSVQAGNIEQVALPWPEPMDAVVMTEVIEHFNFHPVPTMRKVAAGLRPDGRLFLSTPDAASWGRLDRYLRYDDMPQPDPAAPTVDIHIYQFTEPELREVLAAAGFEVIQLERAPGRWGRHLNVHAARRP